MVSIRQALTGVACAGLMVASLAGCAGSMHEPTLDEVLGAAQAANVTLTDFGGYSYGDYALDEVQMGQTDDGGLLIVYADFADEAGAKSYFDEMHASSIAPYKNAEGAVVDESSASNGQRASAEIIVPSDTEAAETSEYSEEVEETDVRGGYVSVYRVGDKTVSVVSSPSYMDAAKSFVDAIDG